MKITRVEQDANASVRHVGLAVVSEMARLCGLNDLCQELTTLKQPPISDAELLRTLCGLLCQGKTDFDHVKAFRDDAFFLGLPGFLWVAGRDKVCFQIHVLAYNLGVLMRAVHGIGTPRSPRERALLAYMALCWLILLSMLIRVVDSDDND